MGEHCPKKYHPQATQWRSTINKKYKPVFKNQKIAGKQWTNEVVKLSIERISFKAVSHPVWVCLKAMI